VAWLRLSIAAGRAKANHPPRSFSGNVPPGRGYRRRRCTPHDFRRTGATAMTCERIGIPRFVVSRVLNQISDTGGASAVTGVLRPQRISVG